MKKVFAILAVFALVFLTMSAVVSAENDSVNSPTAEVITTVQTEPATDVTTVIVSESDTSPTSPQTGGYSGSIGAAAVAVALFGAAAIVFGKKHKEQ